MITINIQTHEDKITILGVLGIACDKCKEGHLTGHGSPKLCENCNVKEIIIHDAKAEESYRYGNK